MTNETEKRTDYVNTFRQEVDNAVKKVRMGGATEVEFFQPAIRGAVEYAKGQVDNNWQRAVLLQKAVSQHLVQRGVGDFRVEVRLQEEVIFAEGQEPSPRPARFKVDFLRNNGNH